MNNSAIKLLVQICPDEGQIGKESGPLAIIFFTV